MENGKTEDKFSRNSKTVIFDKQFILYISIFLLFVIVILFLPSIYVGNCIKDYSDTGEVGDTIGGIMGPFVAIMAALLTFLAFWVQFKANEQQSLQFKNQAKNISIERFENKFYELVSLHRANVEDINIDGTVTKRNAFVRMFEEFHYGYILLENAYESQLEIDKNFEKFTKKQLSNIAYVIFFCGVGPNSNKLSEYLLRNTNQVLLNDFLNLVRKAQENFINKIDNSFRISMNKYITLHNLYKPFNGHIANLSHYYRHLFHTVRFVVDYDKSIIDTKYPYLVTLRAQLSSYEQLLLYYNSLCMLGKPWLDNNYFSEYKMIKNIPFPLADFGAEPKDILPKKNSKGEYVFEWDELSANFSI